MKDEDCKEGDELKKLAVQFAIEKERLENIRKEERKMLMTENVQQIQDVEKMKILQERQDEVRRGFYLVISIETNIHEQNLFYMILTLQNINDQNLFE